MIIRRLLLPLTLICAILFSVATDGPPPVRGVAEPGRFNLINAQALVADIARMPHVSGSVENRRVRDVVANRLRALGLSVEIQSGTSVRQSKIWGGIAIAPYENVIAMMPGKSRASPALAVMSHYDSKPFAPGAGDDASGTSALIEAARILASGPVPQRDVIFLITDAEEMGLIGAQAFFDEHPLAKRIGMVVNAEARGSRGKALMFQTSQNNAALVALWAKSNPRPSGNSMTSAFYKRLPNDTDLSVSLEKGIAGINGAFADGQFDYHMPTDNPASLNPATLQHLGDFTVDTVKALAMAEALPEASGNAAFFDVFGRFVIQYPVWIGWPLCALALFGLWRAKPVAFGTSPARVAGGAAAVLAVTVVAGVAAHLVGGLLYGSGIVANHQKLAEMDISFWMYLTGCLAALFALKPGSAHWLGGTWLMLIIAVAAQFKSPGANWLFVWPALVAVGLLLLAKAKGMETPKVALAAAIVGGLTFALIFQTVRGSYVTIGAMTPSVVALALPFALILFGPLWVYSPKSGFSRVLALILLLNAGGAAGWLWANDSFSARQPKPADLFHLTDSQGKSWWATMSSPAELPPGKAEQYVPTGYKRTSFWRVPAPAAVVPRPEIEMTVDKGRVTLRLASAGTPQIFFATITSPRALPNATLNGKKVDIEAGTPVRLQWRADAPADLSLAFDAGAGGALTLGTLHSAHGLPTGAPKPVGVINGWAFLTHSRTVIDEREVKW
jgi:Peptidase family M28